MSARGEPFVAYLNERLTEVDVWHRPYHRLVSRTGRDDGLTPVVVTPLLPDDPRPGETWISNNDTTVVIVGAVTRTEVGAYVRVRNHVGGEWFAAVPCLRRPPVLKTFRLPANVKHPESAVMNYDYREVYAESKDAALDKLADVLEEIEP